MDWTDFAKGMGVLTALFPDYPLKEDTIDVYWGFLKGYPAKAFEVAVTNHVTKNKWFPKLSELVEQMEQPDPSPKEVWQKLITHAEHGEMPILDAATERALKASVGDWETFIVTPYDELKFLFKEFKEVYQAAREEERRTQMAITDDSKPLLGL